MSFFDSIRKFFKKAPRLEVTQNVGENPLRFALALGFAVNIKEDKIQVQVDRLVFTSDDERGKNFVEGVDDRALRACISTLCQAAAIHVTRETPGVEFARATIPDLNNLLGTKPDPTQLN